MAENADSGDIFKDLLSAALEESGLNDDLVDFGFGFETNTCGPSSASTNSTATSTPQSSVATVGENVTAVSAVSSANDAQYNSLPQGPGIGEKTTEAPGTQPSIVSSTTTVPSNAGAVDGGDEVDLFSQALMQLTATNKQAEVHAKKVQEEQKKHVVTARTVTVTKPATPPPAVRRVVSTQQSTLLQTPPLSAATSVIKTQGNAPQVLNPQNKVTRVLTQDGKIAHILTPQGKVLQILQPQDTSSPERRVRQVLTKDGKIAHVVSTVGGKLTQGMASTPGRVAHVITPQGKVTMPLSRVLSQGGRSSPITIISPQGAAQATLAQSVLTGSPVSTLTRSQTAPVSLSSLNQSPQVARLITTNTALQSRSSTPPPSNAIKIVTIGPKGVVHANGARTVAIPRTSLVGNKINVSALSQSVSSNAVVGSNRVIVNSPNLSTGGRGGFVTIDNASGGGTVMMNRVVTQGVPGTIPGNSVIKTQLTNKDVSRLWANDDISLKSLSGRTAACGSPVTVLPVQPQLEEEVLEEDEELGHAETYAEYMPTKLKLGERHPDPVVETSSLSSVEPPDVWYRLSIPETTIDYCALSALQLESITYACQRHDTFLPSGDRAGYLIGDGAGVGKGRTIAGIIFENYLQGRKRALWLSVSNDLRVDAERDLRDIGAGKVDVHPLNKFKYAKISSKENGSIKKGVIFATYSSLIGESQSGGKYRTRFKQLVHWLGKDEFDGVIVFDECHKAKNLCPVGSSKPTKTGLTVLELQNKLPKARIVYASATGASEPKNMAYMTRLGLWGQGTPFKEFTDFIQAVEKRGVGAMELVAMDMKLRGMYIARQLSFHGVSFRVEEIPIPKDFVQIYNDAVNVWVDAREKFQLAADLIDAEHRMRKTMWGQFWSAHQRFFKYLCISAKVRHCVRLARDAVKNGKCVVIGLQSTGEARTLEQLEESGGELNDFVSTAKGVLQTLVEKHFPAPDRRHTLDSLFGFKSMLDDDILKSKNNNTNKRKMPMKNGNNKKARRDSDEQSSDDSADSDNFSLSSSSSESDADSDDFNPFGNGSDSDDDPWLKKSKAKKKKSKKVKKVKKKKKKKKKDSDAEMDDEFDKALEEAGLKSKGNLQSASFHTSSSQSSSSYLPGMDAVDKAIAMKRELLQRVEELGDCLPPNTLDELIDALGGPDSVAEMTGRKGRVVSNDDGNVVYESRSEIDAPLETLNLTEKQRFMDGEKNIAIISEAASSGISLQADRRAINQRRRVHITLELPWSADRAIQQFGRTHRSNQVCAPEYVFMISDLAGERRFASTVAKRLESLGALTHGDRRATETRDLSRFNIDNKYGRTALEAVMKSILDMENPITSPPADYQGNFNKDMTKGLVGVGMVSKDERFKLPQLEKDYNNISKFLNRILGMEVASQNSLFKYFTDTLAAVILQAKRNGRWDLGILDLGYGEETVKKLETKSFVGNFGGANVKAHLHTILVERGLTWKDALEMWEELSNQEDGFYLSTQMRNGKRTAILIVGQSSRKNRERMHRVYRPNTGQQVKTENIIDIRKKYRKVLPDEARPYWEDQYHLSAEQCIHMYWHGMCKKISAGLSCEIGLRCRKYHVLGGSVLGVWTKVESVLASMPGGHASRMQIIRLKTDDGERVVGSLIPGNCLGALTNVLSQDSNKTTTQQHSLPPLPSTASIPTHDISKPVRTVDSPHLSTANLSMPIIL